MDAACALNLDEDDDEEEVVNITRGPLLQTMLGLDQNVCANKFGTCKRPMRGLTSLSLNNFWTHDMRWDRSPLLKRNGLRKRGSL